MNSSDSKRNAADLPGPFRLDNWLVEPMLNRLSRDGEMVRVEPKVMDLLLCLAGRPGEVLSRTELLEQVWEDVVVSEEVLTRAVSELRRALRDDTRAPRYVETIHKRGYCLIAPILPATGGAENGGREGGRRTWRGGVGRRRRLMCRGCDRHARTTRRRSRFLRAPWARTVDDVRNG